MSENQKPIRAFIAVDLPADVKQLIGDIQSRLRDHRVNCRWVKPAGIHLTLKFLGDVAGDRLDDIHAAMTAATAGQGPFALRAERVGGFPNLGRPRVLWVGLAGDTERLEQLHRHLDQQLAGIGFEPETRRFTGHLTFGRAKGRIDPARLETAVAAVGDVASPLFTVGDIVLFQSVLQPTGAVYTPLRKSALSAG